MIILGDITFHPSSVWLEWVGLDRRKGISGQVQAWCKSRIFQALACEENCMKNLRVYPCYT